MEESKLLPGTSKISRDEAISMAKDIIKIIGVKYVDPSSVTTETPFIKDAGIPVGSLRRKKAEVGDIDIMITAPLDMSKLADSRLIHEISGAEKQRNFVYTGGAVPRKVNLFYFTDPDTFGAALLHTTGPHMYNVRIRALVQKRGFDKLSQLGLFDISGNVVAGKTEGEVQRVLKVTQREPNQRG